MRFNQLAKTATYLSISLFFLLAQPFLFPSSKAEAATAKEKYFIADAAYKKLRNNTKKQKYRDQWLACIKKYKAVYDHDPSGSWAAAGLYMSGELYQKLYKRSYKTSDKTNAIEMFERIIQQFPKSRYRQKAEKALKKTAPAAAKKISAQFSKKRSLKRATFAPEKIKLLQKPKPEVRPADSKPDTSRAQASSGKDSKTVITNLRFWSNPSYTRVVIDADRETAYTHRLLKKDPSINKPQRLYIDLSGSRLSKDLNKKIPIDDNLLKDIRAGQHTADEVRVVVDIKSFKDYAIFSLKNPFRIVIDVLGGERKPTTRPSTGDELVKKYLPAEDKNKKIPGSAIAKQLSLGVKTIIIDPGHGGRDYGAPGYYRGTHERDIVLNISKKLAEKIKKELDCDVILTRKNNKFLSLEERTAIANTKNADLFISIHTNASKDKRAYGIETYFLNLATDDDSIRVAAMENATSTKNISDLQTILSDLMQNAKINESTRLASHVQEAICSNLQQHYSRIKNKGVKQAPFYVLMGANMPSILIETGFISNSTECKRLKSEKYQDRLCDSILKGITRYIKETNPTAFIEMDIEARIKG